jgi:hypothetical protein
LVDPVHRWSACLPQVQLPVCSEQQDEVH